MLPFSVTLIYSKCYVNVRIMTHWIINIHIVYIHEDKIATSGSFENQYIIHIWSVTLKSIIHCFRTAMLKLRMQENIFLPIIGNNENFISKNKNCLHLYRPASVKVCGNIIS